jgi:hypothetical protein
MELVSSLETGTLSVMAANPTTVGRTFREVIFQLSNQDESLQALDSNNGYSTMGVSWESVWGLRGVFLVNFSLRGVEN